jgi:NAD(P)-dependent dehydrogenase (short-subunit alcohol dehydrogenase family)
MPQTIVITGASRGLGLEFTRQYLAAGERVFAMARDPDANAGLRALQVEFDDRLCTAAVDVTDRAAVSAAARRLAAWTDAVDLVVQNAGVAGQTAQRLDQLDPADLRRVFEVNSIAPLFIAAQLLPLLRRGTSPKLVFVTSRMGSIADNDSGGWWAYRMSKAALNMACKNLTFDLAGTGIATMVVHPGWVRTDMGGASAPLTATGSVRGMREVIDELEFTASGCFRDYTGVELPW